MLANASAATLKTSSFFLIVYADNPVAELMSECPSCGAITMVVNSNARYAPARASSIRRRRLKFTSLVANVSQFLRQQLPLEASQPIRVSGWGEAFERRGGEAVDESSSGLLLPAFKA